MPNHSSPVNNVPDNVNLWSISYTSTALTEEDRINYNPNSSISPSVSEPGIKSIDITYVGGNGTTSYVVMTTTFDNKDNSQYGMDNILFSCAVSTGVLTQRDRYTRDISGVDGSYGVGIVAYDSDNWVTLVCDTTGSNYSDFSRSTNSITLVASGSDYEAPNSTRARVRS